MGELPLSPGRHTREDSRVKRGCGLGPGGEAAGIRGPPRRKEVRLPAPSC